MNELQAELDSPASLFQAAVAACIRDDWDTVASLCDPFSLIVFRHDTIKPFLPDFSWPVFEAEDFMRGPHGMSREQAEAHAEQFRISGLAETRLRQEFSGVASVDDLIGMTPQQFFAAYLNGRSIRLLYQRASGDIQLTPEQQAIIDNIVHVRFDMPVVGVVHDSESYAHVIFRDMPNLGVAEDGESNWAADFPAEVQAYAHEGRNRRGVLVATCRRQHDDTWRLIANSDFFSIAGTFAIEEAPAYGDNTGPLPE